MEDAGLVYAAFSLELDYFARPLSIMSRVTEPQISYSFTCKRWITLVTFFHLAWSEIGESQKERYMKDQDLLERITLNPKVMVGKPIIKGTRLTVEYILNLLAHGATTEEVLEEYKGLKPEDIQACFLFATRSLSDTDFMPLMVETV